MSLDAISGSQTSPSDTASDQPFSPAAGTPASSRKRSRMLWPRVLMGVCLIGLLAAATPFILGSMNPEETGPRLTHTIAQGDLAVTVVEQGTLESSSNTEIKCKVRGGSTVLWVIETGTTVKPGDELVRLDPSAIEDRINQQEITYQRALATYTTSENNVAVAKIGIREYEEGTFKQQLKALQKDLAIAESNLRTTKNLLEHSQRMFKRGYASALEVEGNEFSLEQAQLELELKQTEIDVLKEFTKAKELETLRSTLKTAEATLASDKAALDLEKARLDREKEQLTNCVIRAPSAGMVIYPSAAEWKSAPDIEEGANVRQDQVLLLIPDLSQMQVKVGIHESKVDRLKVNMDATVSLLEEQLEGRVASIASVTKPAGWWTGNVVKYDTIVELKPDQDVPLKPGMSVEVQVKIAEHTDVLTIPVAAVVEHEQAYFAWVMTSKGPERRELEVGDSNDEFMVVKTGLKEGDEVIINPRAHVEEARSEALKPVDPSEKKSSAKKDSSDDDSKKTPEAQQQPDAKSESKPDAAEAKAGTKESKTEASPATPSAADLAAKAISEQDQDGDGALSIDEYKEEHRKYFDLTDTNGDGKVDKSEMQAAIQRIIDASKAQQE